MHEMRFFPGSVFMGNITKAEYTRSKNPIYRHNPFIEAIRTLGDDKKLAARMQRSPAYNKNERKLPPDERIDAVQRISHLVTPLPLHFNLARKFDRLIRNGLMNRNPLTKEWKRQIRAGFRNIDWGQDGTRIPIIRSSAAGFCIIGTSGIGKSTASETGLSLFDQVVVHTKYNGTPFDHQQLVWLKLECPHDSSSKGLCKSFFKTVDQVLSTRYEKTHGNTRRTVDDLLSSMAQVAALQGLGVLVIDEIQRLNEAKSGGAQRMLNFFVQLANTIGVPVVLIGTPKALPILNKEFAQARRNSGQGDMLLSNLADDEYWNHFARALWKYQWTHTPTKFSRALSKALYSESQGIADIAVKIYQLVQWEVIGEGNEQITPRLIHEVAKKHLKICRPLLQALRKKQYSLLQDLSDLLPPAEVLNDFLEKTKTRVTIEGMWATLENQEKKSNGDNGNGDEAEKTNLQFLSDTLCNVGYPFKIALKAARKAIKRHGKDLNLKNAIRDAHSMAEELEQKSIEETTAKQTKKKPARKKASISGDLREIVERSDKKTAPYEALKSEKSITAAEEFLE